jgi:hypothetical protein
MDAHLRSHYGLGGHPWKGPRIRLVATAAPTLDGDGISIYMGACRQPEDSWETYGRVNMKVPFITTEKVCLLVRPGGKNTVARGTSGDFSLLRSLHLGRLRLAEKQTRRPSQLPFIMKESKRARTVFDEQGKMTDETSKKPA